MGGATSSYFSTLQESWTNPDVVPSPLDPIRHDPNYGFENPREERHPSKYTEEDFMWAKIPSNRRDYCADHLVDLLRCRKENYPFSAHKCDGFLHEWHHCQYEDQVQRMKEFEREKRLLKREQKKKLAEAVVE